MLEVLYGDFVSMLWQSAPDPRPESSGRRPQPDWWDDDCYDDAMAAGNAAWRPWCHERMPDAQQVFRGKRLQFHHLVRAKKVRL